MKEYIYVVLMSSDINCNGNFIKHERLLLLYIYYILSLKEMILWKLARNLRKICDAALRRNWNGIRWIVYESGLNKGIMEANSIE